MMKKFILSATLGVVSASFFFAGAPVKVIATNAEQYDSYCRPTLLNNIGEIDRTQTININGVENPLYCTFVDAEVAVDDLKLATPDILERIAEEFELNEISVDNIGQYQQYYQDILNVTEYDETDLEYRTLRAFFDIYDNYEANSEIMAAAGTLNGRGVSAQKAVEIGFSLPYYAPLAEEAIAVANTQRTLSAQSTRNTNAAIAYATQYATSPNTSAYGYLNGVDCTNFASQIVEASGVSQAVYDSEFYGWWHKKNGSSHTYSISWQRSDTFVRYMGWGYQTQYHRLFSENIMAGDYIAIDHTSDGSWDHLGFVTSKSSTLLCYTHGEFYDYKVAQHSSNYHAWTSSEDNGWDETEGDGGQYARVRR